MTLAYLEAIETLKSRLISAPHPILPEVMLTVAKDTSTIGITTVMLQDQARLVQPVSYWARELNPAELGNTCYVSSAISATSAQFLLLRWLKIDMLVTSSGICAQCYSCAQNRAYSLQGHFSPEEPHDMLFSMRPSIPVSQDAT
jgi:hypothetical protein